ncbi:MAG TPA: glutathione S-transferase family protein [Alphaproteobacteria bacterium]|nr:glutathione S-transferase family protein [Alphaproteobacteria bacterium]
MHMKLFYCPRTRAFTSLWMLEECGAHYDLARVNILDPEHPTPSYRTVNPMGKVAALEDGGTPFGETAAILLYLADKFPAKRLAPPPNDPRRGRYLQWTLFSPIVIEPAMVAKSQANPVNTRAAGWGDYERAMDALEPHLPKDGWMLGPDFMACDLNIASTLRFGMQFGMIDKRPAFVAFAERAGARQAFQKASEIESREHAAFEADKAKWVAQ